MKSLLLTLGILVLAQDNLIACQHLDYSNKEVMDDELVSHDQVAIPIRKLVKKVQKKDNDELDDLISLNLSKNTIQGPGFNIIVKEILPYVPNLQILDLSYNLIGEKGLVPLQDLLNNTNLKYINIVGNGLARLVLKDIHNKEERLREKIVEKVIVTPKSLINKSFSSEVPYIKNWLATHKKFYNREPNDVTL